MLYRLKDERRVIVQVQLYKHSGTSGLPARFFKENMSLLTVILIVISIKYSYSLNYPTNTQSYALNKLKRSLNVRKGPRYTTTKNGRTSCTETRKYGSNKSINDNGATSKFVPAFFGIWALGYSFISAVDVAGGGLGDSGGYIGAGFAVVLLLTLVGASVYETFRDFE